MLDTAEPEEWPSEDSSSQPDAAAGLYDPAVLAAVRLLRRALSGPQGSTAAADMLVVLRVPSADWVEPVIEAWADAACIEGPPGGLSIPTCQPGRLIVRGQRKGKGVRAVPLEEIARTVMDGCPVLGVSEDQALLPPELVRAASMLVMPLPDLALLTELADAVANDPAKDDRRRAGSARGIGGAPPGLTEEACRRIGPTELRLAMRPLQSASAWLERLCGLLPRPPSTAGLASLPGLGELAAWGRQLATDLEAYRAGRLGWREVDRGVLLSGPPGCGKTSFAAALAAECGVPLIATSYAAWQTAGEGHLGEVLRAMAGSFETARAQAPCILFIDEFDTLGARGTSGHRGDWWRAVINALLEHLDGLGGREGVVVIGATNHPEAVDAALCRSGRLDRVMAIHPPDAAGLAAILRVHLGGELEGVDLSAVVPPIPGVTGADCAKWVRGARRRARAAGRALEVEDLRAEIAGPSDVRPLARRRCVAVHEAGHAIVRECLMPGSVVAVSARATDAADGVMVMRRGQGLETAEAMGSTIKVLLAGRAAEQVLLGVVTGGSGGGATSDLARATVLPTHLETAGEGDRLLWLGLPEAEEVARLLRASPVLAARVETRLALLYDETLALVRRHRGLIAQVADRLLAESTLTGEALRRDYIACKRASRISPPVGRTRATRPGTAAAPTPVAAPIPALAPPSAPARGGRRVVSRPDVIAGDTVITGASPDCRA